MIVNRDMVQIPRIRQEWILISGCIWEPPVVPMTWGITCESIHPRLHLVLLDGGIERRVEQVHGGVGTKGCAKQVRFVVVSGGCAGDLSVGISIGDSLQGNGRLD